MCFGDHQALYPGESTRSLREMGTRGSSGDQLVPVSPGHSQFQHWKFHVLETCQSQENHPSSGPIPRSFNSVGLGWDLRSCLFYQVPCTKVWESLRMSQGTDQQGAGREVEGEETWGLHAFLPGWTTPALPRRTRIPFWESWTQHKELTWLLYLQRPAGRSGWFCCPSKDPTSWRPCLFPSPTVNVLRILPRAGKNDKPKQQQGSWLRATRCHPPLQLTAQ